MSLIPPAFKCDACWAQVAAEYTGAHWDKPAYDFPLGSGWMEKTLAQKKIHLCPKC